jgi:MATE family multidrug resistance protein
MLALATPIVVVQLGLQAMGAVDTMIVGRVSPAALAATALGNLYFFAISIFGMGVLMGLDPVVAQAVGARDAEAVARAVQRGMLISLGLTVVCTLAFIPSGPVFRVLQQPAEIVPDAARYVRISIPGIFPFLAFVVLRQSLQAMGRIAPLVVTVVVANLVNAALDWVLVFGHLGFPRMEVAGSAWSTAVSRWVLLVLLLALAWRELHAAVAPPRRAALEITPLARMTRLGLPIGVQYLLEYGAFAGTALLMGVLGTTAMAAHQIAINIASLTFMIPFGVSAAAAVRVGHAIGAGDSPRARRAAVAALAIGVGFMTLSAVAFLFAPHAIARAYSTDVPVVALAATLIPIAGVFQVFDGTQAVAAGVLRGAGDTHAPFVINIVGFWCVGLPLSWWLAFRAGYGAVGLWWGIVAGLAAVASLLVMRVWSRMRRGMRRVVIETAEGG